MAVNDFLKAAKKIEEQHQERVAEKSHAPHGDDESNWLVSYADMMTLLCGFFIMLFSMAKIDEPKFEVVKESMAKQFGGEYHAPAKEMEKFVTKLLEGTGLGDDVIVRSDPRGVAITFQSTVFFETGSAEVKPEGKIILSKLVEAIATRQTEDNKKYRIVVEGHTDSRPITGGNYPTNWELSSARASRVVRMYLDKGFDSDRLTAIGYADTYPEVPARTPAGTLDESALSKNRRVVIRILEPGVDAIPYPDPPQPEVAAQAEPAGAESPVAVASAAPVVAPTEAVAQASAPPQTESSPLAPQAMPDRAPAQVTASTGSIEGAEAGGRVGELEVQELPQPGRLK